MMVSSRGVYCVLSSFIHFFFYISYCLVKCVFLLSVYLSEYGWVGSHEEAILYLYSVSFTTSAPSLYPKHNIFCSLSFILYAISIQQLEEKVSQVATEPGVVKKTTRVAHFPWANTRRHFDHVTTSLHMSFTYKFLLEFFQLHLCPLIVVHTVVCVWAQPTFDLYHNIQAVLLSPIPLPESKNG